MLDQDLAGEGGRDLLLTVERHVHGEMDRHHPRNLAHVVVDRLPSVTPHVASGWPM